MKNKSSCCCTGAAGLQSTTNLKTNTISGNSSNYSSDSPMSIPHERRIGLRPTIPASSPSNTITEQLPEYSKECNYVSQLSSTTTTATAGRHTSSCSSQEQEQGAQEAQEALSKTKVTTTKLLSSAASLEPRDPKRRYFLLPVPLLLRSKGLWSSEPGWLPGGFSRYLTSSWDWSKGLRVEGSRYQKSP